MKRIESERCLIFVPNGTGPHPVLCFLHGYREAAKDENDKSQSIDKVLANESPAWHAARNTDFVSRFLLICPQLEKQRRWTAGDAPWITSIVQAAITDHAGDPSRLVLTGFSYGGEGAFQIENAVGPLEWRTIWVVDPALQVNTPRPAPARRVWVHHGRWCRREDRVPPGVLEDFKRDIGLRNLALPTPHGERHLTVLDLDHAEVCKEAYGSAWVYDWLLR